MSRPTGHLSHMMVEQIVVLGVDMRKLFMVVVLAWALVGCTPAQEQTPTPSPTLTAQETTPTAQEATPGPLGPAKQQKIIDAVQNYLDLWTQLAHNPQGQMLELIWQVAWAPSAETAVDQFEDWAGAGWHLEGTPVFIPDYVLFRTESEHGRRYSVHGCYDLAGAFLVDGDGNKVVEDPLERASMVYVVLETPEGMMFVTEDVWLGEEC